MIASSIIVAYCSQLSTIYVVRAGLINVVVLFRSICSSQYLLIFDPSFILRVFSIRFDRLIPLGLSLVKSDLLLDRLNTNGLIGKVCLTTTRGREMFDSLNR
jgi:hypothetical protein